VADVGQADQVVRDAANRPARLVVEEEAAALLRDVARGLAVADEHEEGGARDGPLMLSPSGVRRSSFRISPGCTGGSRRLLAILLSTVRPDPARSTLQNR
jgi:hypothetical protein